MICRHVRKPNLVLYIAFLLLLLTTRSIFAQGDTTISTFYPADKIDHFGDHRDVASLPVPVSGHKDVRTSVSVDCSSIFGTVMMGFKVNLIGGRVASSTVTGGGSSHSLAWPDGNDPPMTWNDPVISLTSVNVRMKVDSRATLYASPLIGSSHEFTVRPTPSQLAGGSTFYINFNTQGAPVTLAINLRDPALGGLLTHCLNVVERDKQQAEDARKKAEENRKKAEEQQRLIQQKAVDSVMYGNFAATRGDFDIAFAFYHQALDLDPNNVDAKNGMDRAQRAQSAAEDAQPTTTTEPH